jgi:hypothetical protein
MDHPAGSGVHDDFVTPRDSARLTKLDT